MNQQEFDKQLIKAIPIGELQESIKNFQRISPIDHKAAHIQEALQVYSEEHLVLYESIQKQPLIFNCFMKQNRYKDGYFDQLRAKFVKVDFLSGKIVEQKTQQNAEISLKQNHINFLTQLNNKLFQYLKKYYQGPYGAAFHIQTKQDKITQIKIQFTSKNINLSNFYTGEWLSKWTFTADNKYSSTIEIKNHFLKEEIFYQKEKKIFKEILTIQAILKIQ